MKIKQSRGENIFDVINVIFMLCIVVVMFYPMLYVFFVSISEPGRFMAHFGPLFAPLGITGASYQAILGDPRVTTGYQNTLFIVTAGVACNMFMTIIAAYFLSRKGLMFRNAIMLLILVTMYFSGGLVPSYLVVRGLGLLDSHGALILPAAINTFNMIIMRTAFAGVPDSLEESAKLDGASHITIMTRIMVPLCMPTIAVLILYYGVAHWNSWFPAMIYLQDRNLYPLQLFLREILIQNDMGASGVGADMGDRDMISVTIQYALIIIATVPILALYPFLQRYFVKGVMVGAVKG